jgi:hypothetical protein
LSILRPLSTKTRLSLLAACLATLPSEALGQAAPGPAWDGFLEPARFGKPFLSEMHSTAIKMEIGYSKSYAEFDLLGPSEAFSRPVVELHLGVEAPLFATSFGSSPAGRPWALAVSLPLSVHVLEDMFEPSTAPVINTDYRYGTPRFSVLRRFAGGSFVKNASLSWLPMFHECTHLGDEITIFRKDENFPITRINVSYEYTELQLTLTDVEDPRAPHQSLRAGAAIRVSDRGLGWFSVREDTELTEPLDIPHSNLRAEWYLAYQGQWNTGVLASRRFAPVVSFELRQRPRYGYPMFRWTGTGWETRPVEESMDFTFNLYVGGKFFPRAPGGQSLGLYFHAYRGINPYGQLRNHPGYPFFGVSLAYEP